MVLNFHQCLQTNITYAQIVGELLYKVSLFCVYQFPRKMFLKLTLWGYGLQSPLNIKCLIKSLSCIYTTFCDFISSTKFANLNCAARISPVNEKCLLSLVFVLPRLHFFSTECTFKCLNIYSCCTKPRFRMICCKYMQKR